LGSDLAASYFEPYLFRGTSAIKDVKPSPYLTDLNKDFSTYAKNIATLSVGEAPTCFYRDTYSCLYIVSPESARGLTLLEDPKHQFLEMAYDHRNVCKVSTFV